VDQANRDWRECCEARRRHLDAIRPDLPERARPLADTTFHDGIVESALQPSPSEVVLLIDASDNPWGPQGRFELIFRGVKKVSNLPAIVGDYWLYEEIDLHPAASFQYNILLGASEFEILADDIEVREHAA
jgi:hypothetical protein